jgi:hypothetical protein
MTTLPKDLNEILRIPIEIFDSWLNLIDGTSIINIAIRVDLIVFVQFKGHFSLNI